MDNDRLRLFTAEPIQVRGDLGDGDVDGMT
jgi:hypothetical protein